MAAPEQWWIVWHGNPDGSVSGTVEQSPTKPPVRTENGVQTSSEGPYATRAEAETALKNRRSENPIGLGVGAAEQTAGPAIPNPFSWLGVIGHWIGDLVEHLTDAAMWKSIGWILLGILLIITGILLWVKQNTGSLPVPFPAPV